MEPLAVEADGSLAKLQYRLAIGAVPILANKLCLLRSDQFSLRPVHLARFSRDRGHLWQAEAIRPADLLRDGVREILLVDRP